MATPQPQTLPAIDAVVVAWNRWELTEKCLDRLTSSSAPIHLIVVDNGSSDGTPARVRERFPQATLIELPENRGFPIGANTGVQAATRDFVAIVNSDALVADDYFELLLERMSPDPSIGFAAGLSIDPQTGKVDAAGTVFDRGLRWSQYLHGADPDDVVVDERVLAAPSFEAILFRREAFVGVGGFDSEIFAYQEDLDLTLRLRAAGWRLALVPAARNVHKGAASFGKRTAQQMRLVGWGRGYVAGRYRLGPGSLLLDLATYAGISVIVRSPGPLTELISGWRRGRGLPRKTAPTDLHRESAIASLRKRWQASRE